MPGVVSATAAVLGAYVDSKRPEIINQIFNKSGLIAECSTHTSDAQEGQNVGIHYSVIDEVVQPFQKTFTAKGTLNLSASKITQRRHKVDFSFHPDDIAGSWEGFLLDENKKREDYPLVKYIINDKLMPKVEEDRMNQVWNGSYVAPTVGVAEPAVEAVHGFKKIIADAITATEITPFALGAITSANAFEYLESFLTSIPSKFRYKAMTVHMSSTNALYYLRDRRGTFPYERLSGENKVDFSNLIIKGHDDMEGSNRIFCTLPGNMLRIVHKKRNAMTNIDVEPAKREIAIMADWYECFGFAIITNGTDQYVFCNDQA